MPESQNPVATEPTADPAEEIQAKKAAAAELNGNDVKNGDHEPSTQEKEDPSETLEGEDDEDAVEGEDDEDQGDESPEAAEVEAEKNGKQNRKRTSNVNGHDEETESNGEQPEIKKTRQEAEEVEDDESTANLVEAEE